jgi:glyoxylase-like metal-dependent hydrolase (beta-lactamase superfamily II)
MSLQAAAPARVADGVWRIRGGFPVRMMNVFLLEEPEGGVTVFDAGVKPMGAAIRAAGERLGGIRRVVLGNAHADHRGGANALGAPVLCHADERADVEGDGGAHYFDYGKIGLPPARLVSKASMKSWDDGPVAVAGTLAEGDEVAGFRVVALPGHGPGCIGLWRESDRLAISNDCFALFDPQLPRPGPPRVPHPAFNWSTERARESIEKLAAMEPATCWPGHFGPVMGDVAGQLRRALQKN